MGCQYTFDHIFYLNFGTFSLNSNFNKSLNHTFDFYKISHFHKFDDFKSNDC